MSRLEKFNIRGLLDTHSNSLSSLLREVYPEFGFLLSEFQNSPRQAMDNPNIVRAVIDRAGMSFSVKRFCDWYKHSGATLFAAVPGGMALHLLRLLRKTALLYDCDNRISFSFSLFVYSIFLTPFVKH